MSSDTASPPHGWPAFLAALKGPAVGTAIGLAITIAVMLNPIFVVPFMIVLGRTLFLSIVLLAVYLVGVVRLRRTGVAWPWWRTASWVVGTASLFSVTGTWLNGYSMVLFSVHMSQHMVL